MECYIAHPMNGIAQYSKTIVRHVSLKKGGRITWKQAWVEDIRQKK